MKLFLAEVLGTFLLVFIGCASIVMGDLGSALPLGQIGIGLAFGLGLVAAAYAIGPISGAHLNPAVTLGFFLAGRLPAKDVVTYWIAQVVGAVVATVALWIMVSAKVGDPVGNFGATTWDPAKWGTASVFLTEMIATFTFVLVILASTSAKHMNMLAGLIIGLTLAALHLGFVPVTGNSLNPARSIGPNLFSGSVAIGQLWLYIVAPLVGGAIAGIVAKTGVFEKD